MDFSGTSTRPKTAWTIGSKDGKPFFTAGDTTLYDQHTGIWVKDSQGKISTGYFAEDVSDPSFHGIYITSTPGGETYEWESTDAGFDPSDIVEFGFDNGDTFTKTPLTPEVTTISNIPAGSVVTPGSYFTLSSPSTQYYVWYKVSGSGTDPAPAGGNGTFYPAADGDDGYWSAYTNDFVYTGPGGTITFGNIVQSGTPYPYNAFIRFPNIGIPQGGTIRTCRLKFTPYLGPYDGANCKVNIHFNNSDNAAAPTSHAGADALSLTDAVPWSPVPTWLEAVKYTAPDIKTILQAVVDRAGFSSGNAVMVLVEDDDSSNNAYRDACPYDWDSQWEGADINRAALYVEWGLWLGGTGIEVDILTTDSATDVAVKTAAALEAYSSGAVFDVPEPATPTIVVTNVIEGSAVDPGSDDSTGVDIDSDRGTETLAYTSPVGEEFSITDVFSAGAMSGSISESISVSDLITFELFTVTKLAPSAGVWLDTDATPLSATLTAKACLIDADVTSDCTGVVDSAMSVGIDLGSAKAVGKLIVRLLSSEVTFPTTWGAKDSLVVYSSPDNSTWTLEQTFNAPTLVADGNYIGHVELVLTTPVSARYFKVYASDGGLG